MQKKGVLTDKDEKLEGTLTALPLIHDRPPPLQAPALVMAKVY